LPGALGGGICVRGPQERKGNAGEKVMQALFIVWTKKMSVGVEVLDADHKKLIALLNDLHDGIAAGHGTERLERVLDGLVDYVGTHFAHEEEYFAQTGYPGAAEHIQEHRAMTKLLLDVQARYNKGKFEALSLGTMNSLKDWLDEHVQGTDKKYTAHLNASGIF
jgi:hemerythrin-like metal-binding protein